MINCSNHAKNFTLADLPVEFDSKKAEQQDVNKLIVGIDTYSYSIQDCKIHEDKTILKILDNANTSYLRVFDLTKKILTYYIEGSRF